MKVLFLINSLGGGGAERIVSYLSLYLPPSFDRDILIFDKNVAYEHGANKLICKEIDHGSTTASKAYAFIRRLMFVRKQKKVGDYDVVISFLQGNNILNLLTAYNEKRILSVRNYRSLSDGERPLLIRAGYKFFTRFLYGKADGIVSISNGVGQDLVKNYGVPCALVKTIYNFLDVDKHREDRAGPDSLQLDENFINIVTIGRLQRPKGQWHLIRTMRLLKECVPNIRLHIIGSGNLRADLEELVISLGLADNVVFWGFLEDPFEIMRQCDVFVLSSLSEGFGNVLIEAMVCGLPVVSADCKSGPKEVLAPDLDLDEEVCGYELGQYGILTEPFNQDFDLHHSTNQQSENVLAKALELLLKDKTLLSTYKEKSQERVGYFSKETIIGEWQRTIEAIVS